MGREWARFEDMAVCERLARHRAPSARESRVQEVSLSWIGAPHGETPTCWADLSELDWSRFRLVLGAGGATGAAFAAGVLLALTTDHGVALRNASHMVGTSAGSVVAALIAMGLDGDDLAAVVARTPEASSSLGTSGELHLGDELPPSPKLRNLMRPMGPRDIVHSAGLAATRRYRALWLNCLRPGTFDLARQIPFIPALAWPSEGRLSVCCTDAATGDRVVFERDSGVEMADVITASCAVPGIMRPVTVGDRVLVDGGVVSPTNADIALDDGEETLTVVVSPMSGTGARSTIARGSSRFASSRLNGELRRCDSAGGVLVIEPAASLGALITDGALDSSTTNQILAASFLASSDATITRRHPASRHAN